MPALLRHALPAVALAASLAGLLGAGPAAAADAAESAPITSERATVTLIAEHTGVAPGGQTRLALRYKLAPKWHIYWSNPGDAGQPPQLELQGPPGTQYSGFSWPVPQRLPEGPVMTYAYTGEVVLPLTVQIPADAKPGSTVPVVAQAQWLICEHVCIPEEGRFELALPVVASTTAGTPGPSAQAPHFQAADARMPGAQPALQGARARIEADGSLHVESAAITPAAVADAWFFPAAWGPIEHGGAQQATVQPGRLALTLVKGPAFDPQAQLEGLLVLRGPDGRERGYEIRTAGEKPAAARTVPAASELREAVASLAGPKAAGGTGTSATTSPAAMPSLALFLRTLLFAFLGGLILNLMPCVFPVLAMKAVAVARLGGHTSEERHEVRLHAALYTAGVLVAFAALAGVMLAIRAGGSSVGWGFQFQSPVFVAAMAWLLFAIGLNLSGVFQIGAGLAGMGQGLAARPGHAGSFFTGLLAVVVATPCTAPFMGAAIASALAAPAAFTVGTFLAMGLGLALPYVLLALVPGLAERLPRPGAWMERLKQALAFPMYAAAVWLVWVLSQQAANGVLVALAGALLLGLAGWAWGVAQGSAGRGLGWRASAAVAALAALAVLPRLHGTAAPSLPQAQAATGQPGQLKPGGPQAFSADQLAQLRAAGTPVFVNMTAAWCVTCLMNERVALSTAAVQQALAEGGVTYLKGDWTNQNPEITRFLREHGRDGVPLYVLYPRGGAQPVVLPQILTEGIVLDHLHQHLQPRPAAASASTAPGSGA